MRVVIDTNVFISAALKEKSAGKHKNSSVPGNGQFYTMKPNLD
jgi:predicted nucleic acid-binding protein